MFGPDSPSSLTIGEVSQLVRGSNSIHKALNNPIDKNNNEQFLTVKSIFEKSLAINKDLCQGHILTFEDLEAKKPKGYGIDALEFEKVIGKKIVRNLSKWDFLNQNDIES